MCIIRSTEIEEIMKKKGIILLIMLAIVCTACKKNETPKNEDLKIEEQQNNKNTINNDKDRIDNNKDTIESDKNIVENDKDIVEDNKGTIESNKDITEQDKNTNKEEDGKESKEDLGQDSGNHDSMKESWKVIQEYGFENGYSILSFLLDGKTLKDCGDYYSITAAFGKPITVPGNLKIEDTYKFVCNELTEQTILVTYSEEGILKGEHNEEYYYNPSEDGSDVILYSSSYDREDAPFYNGVLYIRKDAVTGAAILQQPYKTVTEEDLTQEDMSYNGVAFDKDGRVTELIFFGD